MMHVFYCSGVEPPSSGFLWCVDCDLGPVWEVDTDVDIAEPLSDLQD